jgi:hypothetical protein
VHQSQQLQGSSAPQLISCMTVHCSEGILPASSVGCGGRQRSVSRQLQLAQVLVSACLPGYIRCMRMLWGGSCCCFYCSSCSAVVLCVLLYGRLQCSQS